MPFCKRCGAQIEQGIVCSSCTASEPGQKQPGASSLVPLRELLFDPTGTVRSIMGRNDLSIGITLLAIALGAIVLGRILWWVITPKAVFALGPSLANWAGWLLYQAAWVLLLIQVAPRIGLRAPDPIQVLNGVAASRLVPSLLGILFSIASGRAALQVLISPFYIVTTVYTWYAMIIVARQLSPQSDKKAFQLLLLAGIGAELVDTVWDAIF